MEKEDYGNKKRNERAGTKPLNIRHVEPGDGRGLYELYSMPKAIAGTLQLPFPSESVWLKKAAEPPQNMKVLVCEVDSKVVGSASIEYHMGSLRRRHVGYIGMAVHDDYQGMGVGSALLAGLLGLADNWLGLLRIELNVFVDNEPAIGLYEKFGFEHEGVAKKFAFRDGEYMDVYYMARLKN